MRQSGDDTVIVDGNLDVQSGLHVYGKLTVDGLIDPTGVQLTPQDENPGDANTIWFDQEEKMRTENIKVETIEATSGISISGTQVQINVYDDHTVTSGEVTAKKFTLPYPPVTKVIAGVVGGSFLLQDTSFEIINDDEFSWNGKTLDGDIAENDVIVFTYGRN